MHGVLEMAAILIDLAPGDEVIMPSFTFVSTANAVVRLVARPVFVDIRDDTLNIDEALIEKSITPCTRAIFAVHYAGVGCEMDRIMGLARSHGLRVVEDAAQGVNARYKGRALGSIGDLGAFSFHETKNYICGEGGALCINEPAFVERAEIIRDKGTNRRQFFRGQVDKYTWVDIGSSYVPSEVCSAFLYAQLELLDSISERRRIIHEIYRKLFEPLEAEGLVRLPIVPEVCEGNYHLFHILLPDRATRDELMEQLAEIRHSRGLSLCPVGFVPNGSNIRIRRGGFADHGGPEWSVVEATRLLRDHRGRTSASRPRCRAVHGPSSAGCLSHGRGHCRRLGRHDAPEEGRLDNA